MFIFTYDLGNANQNHNMILPHTNANSPHETQNKTETSAGERRKRNPLTLLVGVKMEMSAELLQTLKIDLT